MFLTLWSFPQIAVFKKWTNILYLFLLHIIAFNTNTCSRLYTHKRWKTLSDQALSFKTFGIAVEPPYVSMDKIPDLAELDLLYIDSRCSENDIKIHIKHQ